MLKYELFWSKLPTTQNSFTSLSPNDLIFSCCVFWTMDGVTCAIFLASIAFVAEIMIDNGSVHVW